MCFSKTFPVLALLFRGFPTCSPLSVMFDLLWMSPLQVANQCTRVDGLCTNWAWNLFALWLWLFWPLARLLMTSLVCDVSVTSVTVPTLVQVILHVVLDPSAASGTFLFPCSDSSSLFLFSFCLFVLSLKFQISNFKYKINREAFQT